MSIVQIVESEYSADPSINSCHTFNANETLTDQFASGVLQGKILRNEIDPHTLIHDAILENSPEVIKFLLDHGVDVDYPDKNGITPLMMSIVNQCNYAVEILLEYGADPSTKWKDGRTMLRFALMLENMEAVELLINHNAKVDEGAFIDSLRLASNTKDAKEKKEWLEITEAILERSNTALSDWAFEQIVMSGFTSLLKIYFAKFGNEQIDNIDGHGFNKSTPLQKAILKGDYEMVRLLINFGAKVNSNATSLTPLMTAIYSQKLDIVRLLVDFGADVNKPIKATRMETDSEGNVIPVEINFYPLDAAISQGSPDIIRYLLQQGAISES